MAWMDCVKQMKKAIAAKKSTYNQSGYLNITVAGKSYTVRRDCSGYVSACLEMFGVFGHNYRTNSTGFSHNSTVASKLKAAGFTKKSWTGWGDLKEGCIISDDYSHVEIFSHNDGSTHYVYSNGSTTGLRASGVTKDGGGHNYDTVWFPPNTAASTTQKTSCPYTEPTVTIVKGSSNKEGVKWVQWHLIQAGFLSAKNSKGKTNIDGSFGNGTYSAVIAFQTKYPECGSNGKPDGKVGAGSRRKLKSLV